MVLDARNVLIRQFSGKGVYFGRSDKRALALRHELDALRAGVCALVKLAGKRFHTEHTPAGKLRQRLIIAAVDHRFGKNIMTCQRINLFVYPLHVISAKNTHLR